MGWEQLDTSAVPSFAVFVGVFVLEKTGRNSGAYKHQTPHTLKGLPEIAGLIKGR